VNHVQRAVVIQDEHHLKQPAAESAAPDEPLVIFTVKRVWGPGVTYDGLDFEGLNSMRGNVLEVPPVPSRVYLLII
jgi:hypothetical protein